MPAINPTSVTIVTYNKRKQPLTKTYSFRLPVDVHKAIMSQTEGKRTTLTKKLVKSVKRWIKDYCR